MVYEFLPLMIPLFFLGMEVVSRQNSRWKISLRTGLLAAFAMLLSFNWSLSKPWQLITHPLMNNPGLLDWTKIELQKPAGEWMHAHLPEEAVLLIFYGPRWNLPRTRVSAMSPLLKDLHDPQLPLDKQMDLLARLGVTHVVDGEDAIGGIAHLGFPCWPDMDKVPFLRKIYPPHDTSDNSVSIYEIIYPPAQQQILESDLPRPWLQEYATVGIIRP